MKKYLTRDFGTKILSLFFAFILWIFVGLQNPELQRNYRDIPIRYGMDGSATNLAGLSVINNKTTRVEVVARGKRSLLTSFSSNEVRAWVDISGIKEPGTYTLDVQITMPVTDLLIERITPAKVNLRLDRIITREVPVVLYVENNLDPSGYSVGTQTISPQTLKLTGPEAEVELVKEARVAVSVDSNGINGGEYNYTLVDTKGQPIDASFIKADVEMIQVSVPVEAKKEVPLTVDFINNTAGWKEEEINTSIYPEKITIAGDKSVLDTINSISLGEVDLSKITDTFTETRSIVLPNGVKNQSGIASATIGISLNQVDSKMVTISKFEVINPPANAEALVTSRFVDVKILGRKEVLDAIDEGALVGKIDLQSKQIAYGDYQFKFTVDLPDGAALHGEYEVSVRILQKQGRKT